MKELAILRVETMLKVLKTGIESEIHNIAYSYRIAGYLDALLDTGIIGEEQFNSYMNELLKEAKSVD